MSKESEETKEKEEKAEEFEGFLRHELLIEEESGGRTFSDVEPPGDSR